MASRPPFSLGDIGKSITQTLQQALPSANAYPVGSPMRAQLDIQEQARNRAQAEREVGMAKQARDQLAQAQRTQREKEEFERTHQRGFRGRMSDLWRTTQILGVAGGQAQAKALTYDLSLAPDESLIKSYQGDPGDEAGQLMNLLMGPRGIGGSVIGLVPPAVRAPTGAIIQPIAKSIDDVRREALIEPISRGLSGASPFGGLSDLSGFDDPNLPNTIGRAVVNWTDLDPDSGAGQMLSGGLDLLSGIFLDPTVVAGKGGMVAKEAILRRGGFGVIDNPAYLAKVVDSAAATEVVAKMEGLAGPEIADRFFANHTYGYQIGQAFADAGDSAGKKLVLKSMLGDGEALAELTAKHATAGTIVENLQANLDSVQRSIMDTPSFFPGTKAALEGSATEMSVQLGAQRLAQEQAERAVNLWKELDRLPRETRPGRIRVGTSPVAEKMGARSDWYQDSGAGRAIHTVFDRLPKNTVDLNRPTAAVEMKRTLNAARVPIVEQDALLAKFTQARESSVGQASLVAQQIEERAIRQLTETAGLNAEDLNDLLIRTRQGKGEFQRRINQKAYAGDGRDIVDVSVPDGPTELVHYPLAASQAPNFYALNDFNEVRRVVTKWGQFKARNPRFVGMPTNIANEVNNLWRQAAVGRIATSALIQMDAHVRMYVKFGALANTQEWFRQSWGTARRWVAGVERGERGLVPLKVRGVEVPAALGETAEQATLYKGVISGRGVMRNLVQKEAELFDQVPAFFTRKNVEKAVPVKEGVTVRAADRTNYGIVQTVDREAGTAMVKFVNKAEGTEAVVQLRLDELTGLSKAAAREGRMPGQIPPGSSWGTVAPSDPQHLAAMTYVLNNHFGGGDAMFRRLLEGQSDTEIVRWLRSSEAREYTSQIPLRMQNPEKWVATARAELDNLTGGAQPIAREPAGYSSVIRVEGEEFPVFIEGRMKRAIDELPPPPEDMVRLWRGGKEGAWFTDDLDAAADFGSTARRHGEAAGQFAYVDVPAGQLDEIGPGTLVNDAGGREFKLPENLARQATRVAPSTTRPVPNDLRQLMIDQKVTPADIERAMPDPSVRPYVNGPVTEQLSGRSQSIRFIQKGLDTWFKTIFAMPDDVLSRQPTMRRFYNAEMTRLVEGTLDQGVTLTDDLMQTFVKRARNKSIDETKRLLYDLSDQSRVAELTKFVIPFFEPMREQVTVYAQLLREQPQRVARVYALLRSPARAGFLYDEKGNVIGADGKHRDPNTDEIVPESMKGQRELIRVPLPGWARDVTDAVPFFTGAFKGKQSFTIDRNSIRVGFPQELGGFGPVVQIPVNEVVKRKPAFEESLRFVLPYGPNQDSILKQLMPAYLKQSDSAEENRTYAGIEIRTYFDKLTEFREDTGRVPTEDEKQTMIDESIAETNNFWHLRSVIKFTTPFAVGFDSPYKPYADAYRAAQSLLADNPDALPDEDGNTRTADEWFLDTYGGEYFAMTQSVTRTLNGIPSTVRADAEAKRVGDLIEKYPDFGRLIVGEEGSGEFSRSVYLAQLERPLRPGTTQKWREPLDLQEAKDAPEIDEGWRHYLAGMDIIDARMQERGLANLSSAAAAPVKAQRDKFVAGLEKEYPAWARSRQNIDQGKWGDRIEALTAISTDPRLSQRPEIEMLGTYLEGRKVMADKLAKRKAAGGAGTFTAQSNYDLKMKWEDFGNKLAQENLGFSDIYHRYLESDMVVG